MKNRLSDDAGATLPIMFLLFIPMFVLIIVGVFGITMAVGTADVDVQDAVSIACKSAALNINEAAQAEGLLRINSLAAHQEFRKMLTRNLALNENLKSINGAYLGKPKYWFVVYNGYGTIVAPEALPAHLFYFDGNVVTETNLTYNGLPADYSVDENGIRSGIGGIRSVHLECPGVIGLVKIQANHVIGTEPIWVVRWSAARVVPVNSGFHVR